MSFGVNGFTMDGRPRCRWHVMCLPHFSDSSPRPSVAQSSHWRNVDKPAPWHTRLTPSAQRYEGGGLQFGLLEAMIASVRWMNESAPMSSSARAWLHQRRARLRESVPNSRHQFADSIARGNSQARDGFSAIAREMKSRRVVFRRAPWQSRLAALLQQRIRSRPLVSELKTLL